MFAGLSVFSIGDVIARQIDIQS